MASKPQPQKSELPTPAETPLLTLRHPSITVSDALFAGEEISQRLRSLSDSIGPSYIQNQFYRRVRVKGQASLREKVKRKQQGAPGGRGTRARPLYSFRDLTDIVGFRIVTLYDNDLFNGLDHIVNLVKVGQREPQPLFDGSFAWHGFQEGHFYLRGARQQKDVYVQCAEKLCKLISEECASDDQKVLCKVQRIEPPEDGEQYSSAHLIFDAIGYFKNWRLVIPVEFQLRTAIEDIWAEINHKLLYKIQSPYVWNRDFERSYRGAQQESGNLKNATHAFPALVAGFYRESEDAQKELESFSDPGVSSHFSLCMALFSNLGSRNLEKFEERLRTYHRILEPLPSMPSGHEKALKFRGAMGVVRQMREILEKMCDAPDKGERGDEEVERLVSQQRIWLCDLELLRLEILIAVLCRHLLLKDGKMKYVGRQRHEKEWEKGCADAYERLCRYRASSEPLVRPAAMIHYWKFWIAYIFDKRVAKKNIENAYEELKYDKSLPWYSIYYVLIPRMRAAIILEEAATSIDTFAGLGQEPKNLHGLSADLKADLIQAFGYALEAFKRSRNPHDRRGDIVFGFETNDRLTDGDQVLTIFVYFYKTFGTPITESKQIEPSDIKAVIRYLKKQDMSRLRKDVGVSVMQTIQAAETLAKKVLHIDRERVRA